MGWAFACMYVAEQYGTMCLMGCIFGRSDERYNYQPKPQL